MISHFLRLEWKQYFRSSYWQTGLALKIVMGFFALYFLVSFLAVGIGGYYLLEDQYPDKDPLQVVNSFLIFVFLGDLVFRYLMQKLPVLNIKPFLILPIKKDTLVHYTLGKSIFSFFNVLGLFFYIPFSLVLIKEGYAVNGVLGWLTAIFFTIISLNFLNFLINKNNIAFWFIAVCTVGLIGLYNYNILDVGFYSNLIFNSFVEQPALALIPLALSIVLYWLNFKFLRTKVFLDDAIGSKVKEAQTAELAWANKMGDVAPFIKNDIRLIWRNKRTKTLFFMSFVFLFYGLIFFDNPIYRDKMPGFLLFAALFVTGGFALNYGQFIPAWDSSHYKLLMSQNIRYRKFLESKWFLMVTMTGLLYVLSLPYLYYGINIFLMITAGAIFNIGFNSLFLLYAGSFNRKRIDLEKSGFSNMQGTSATQFIIIIPLMLFPVLIFWIFSSLISFNAGIVAVAATGLAGLVFRNYFMNLIVRKYIRDKYDAISAFEQKN